MGKFPVTEARQELGFTPSTAVRANIDVSTGEGAVGAAIGQGLLKLGEQYNNTIAQTQLSEFQRQANEEMARLELSFATNQDPETYRAEYQKSLSVIRAAMPKNSKAAQGANLWLNAKEPSWLGQVDKSRIARANDNWEAELFQKQGVIGETGVMGSFPMFLAEGVKAGRIDKSDGVKVLANTRKMATVGQITNLYRSAASQETPELQEATYQAARDLTNASALDILKKESLLKTIDLTEKQTKRKTIDLDAEADMAVNDSFVSLIMGKNLLPDVVQNSRLDDKTPRGIFSTDKLSKQEWTQYVGASFDAAPTKTTPKGYSSVSETVLDYAKFQIPKETAWRRLLDSRYIHKEITDQDFTWAVNHINNPYPRHLVADIETVMKSNSEAIAKGGFLWGLITSDAEEEKARVTNTELISWIDNEIAQDREPTRDQMYDKSAQLRAQSGVEKPERAATPETQADYDKLPSGTTYLDPETGKLYRKQ